MVTVMMLAAVLSAQDPSLRHVRATEPKILALIETGLSRSATFRRLVETLDGSDVIVYIEPKLARHGLGGYLAHSIVVRGGYRYLRIAIDWQGANGRVIPLLAHELQHAVEVSTAPDARDATSLAAAFERLSVSQGCAGSTSCTETQAAINIELTVREELATSIGRAGSAPLSSVR
jgi:hypothetical protein